MATTTVPGGPGGPTLTFTFGSSAGLTVAQQIANALGAASSAGTLTQTTVAGGASGSLTIPTVGGGRTSDLIIESAPTVPTTVTGSGVVTDNSPTPSTITAGPGVTLLVGTSGGVFTATGTGAEIGAFGGSNTITASGSGETIGGGTGSNLLVLPSGSSGDTVVSSGSDTITSAGSKDLIIENAASTSGGTLITETGSGDTIVGGANPTTVNASGGVGSVGGVQYFAGSGSLTFVGGSQTASILGGTGPEFDHRRVWRRGVRGEWGNQRYREQRGGIGHDLRRAGIVSEFDREWKP